MRRARWNNWRNASILFAVCAGATLAASRSPAAWSAMETAVGWAFVAIIAVGAVIAIGAALGLADTVVSALARLLRLS